MNKNLYAILHNSWQLKEDNEDVKINELILITKHKKYDTLNNGEVGQLDVIEEVRINVDNNGLNSLIETLEKIRDKD